MGNGAGADAKPGCVFLLRYLIYMYLDEQLGLVGFQVLAEQLAQSLVLVLGFTLFGIGVVREQLDGVGGGLVLFVIFTCKYLS